MWHIICPLYQKRTVTTIIHLEHQLTVLMYHLHKVLDLIDLRMFSGQGTKGQLLLSFTAAMKHVLLWRKIKRNETWSGFYPTEAMTNWDWMSRNNDQQHVITQVAQDFCWEKSTTARMKTDQTFILNCCWTKIQGCWNIV